MTALVLLLWSWGAVAAPAPPPELEGVGLDAEPGALLPLDVALTDTDGQTRSLGAWLDGEPALLMLAYYRCPMLCDVVVRETAAAAASLPAPGPRALVVSFDPHDTPETARDARGDLDWPFLVGSERDVDRLLDAVGMRVRVDEATGRIAHPAAVFVVSPAGRLASVVAGPRPDADALARALGAAGEERYDQGVLGWVLSCFRWEPTHRTTTPRLERLMRAGGLAIFGAFALFLGGVALRGRR